MCFNIDNFVRPEFEFLTLMQELLKVTASCQYRLKQRAFCCTCGRLRVFFQGSLPVFHINNKNIQTYTKMIFDNFGCKKLAWLSSPSMFWRIDLYRRQSKSRWPGMELESGLYCSVASWELSVRCLSVALLKRHNFEKKKKKKKKNNRHAI